MKKLACLVAGALLATPAAVHAQAAPEAYIGGFAHDVSDNFVGSPHEDGTADVEVGVRSQRYTYFGWLKPNWYGKAEVNLSGRSSFYTFGFEFRKHVVLPNLYIGAGAGLTYDDGLRAYRNPYDPGITAQEAQSRLEIERKYKAMGSDVLFNPNIFAGYEISQHWAVEGAWDHYSHATLLGKRNPGMDNFGARLVHRFGAR